MRVTSRLALAAALLAPMLTISTEFAFGQDWRDRIHYPARVRAIAFDNGSISLKSALTLGNWQVSFDGKPAVARYDDKLPQFPRSCSAIKVTGLVCRNPVDGRKGCSMSIATDCAVESSSPTLVTFDSGGATFTLPPPQRLDLER